MLKLFPVNTHIIEELLLRVFLFLLILIHVPFGIVFEQFLQLFLLFFLLHQFSYQIPGICNASQYFLF